MKKLHGIKRTILFFAIGGSFYSTSIFAENNANKEDMDCSGNLLVAGGAMAGTGMGSGTMANMSGGMGASSMGSMSGGMGGTTNTPAGGMGTTGMGMAGGCVGANCMNPIPAPAPAPAPAATSGSVMNDVVNNNKTPC